MSSEKVEWYTIRGVLDSFGGHCVRHNVQHGNAMMQRRRGVPAHKILNLPESEVEFAGHLGQPTQQDRLAATAAARQSMPVALYLSGKFGNPARVTA
jgi:hypothetical protein